MYFSAGFMTASLVFSVGCFVSKYKAKENARKRKAAATNDPEVQLVATAPANVYVNEGEGSCDSDQKSYAYWAVDPNSNKSSEDLSQSLKSTKRSQRESYDFVERNRIDSPLLLEKETPNPYNHVTVDMEVTEYDNAYYIKPRTEAKDPTYSHLSEVKPNIQSIATTTNHNNNTISNTAIMPGMDCKKGKQKKEKSKEKKKKKQEIEKQDKPVTLKENENEKSETKMTISFNQTKQDEKINFEEKITEDGTEEPLNRSQSKRSYIYSVVNKTKPEATENNDETDGKEGTFHIICQNDDKISPLINSSDESNTSSVHEDSTESSDKESSVPSSSEESTVNSGSEIETETGSNEPPPAVAFNQMYEDFTVTDGKFGFTSEDDLNKQQLEALQEESEENS